MKSVPSILLAGVVSVLALAVSRGEAAAPSCNRTCLVGMADRFVEAMVRQQPKSLPWADTVRYSEDGVPMMVGDALWGSIRAARAPVMYAADPANGQVVWFGIVEEHGDPAYLALRLKIVGGKIFEIESVLSRTAPFGDPHPYSEAPAFAELVPTSKQVSRVKLVAAANSYLDSALRKDGKGTAPIGAGCVRVDNGKLIDPTLGGDCGAQLKLAAFSATDRIRARAFPVVDEARGVVVVTGVMDFSARMNVFKTTDGVTRPTATVFPESQAFMQMFKIDVDGVRRIETVYSSVPYLMPSPWTR